MTDQDFLLAAALNKLSENDPYQRGVLGMLRILGLVTIENGQAVPSGEVAQMVIASLAAHADEGQPIGFNWNDLDTDGLRGVDILRAFEAARAARAEAGPGRRVHVVQGVIKGRRADIDYYLMQYDAHAQQYQPIGGKVDPTDTDAASALHREIAEELGFDDPPPPETCALTLIRAGWMTLKVSATYGVLTEYVFDFYQLTRIGFPIEQTGFTRWLRRGEIERARADDSRSISTIYLEALGMETLDALPVTVEMT